MASVNRHLLLVVLSALLPLLLAAVVLAILLVQAERKSTEHGLQESAQLLSQAVDAELQRSFAALQALSRSDSLRRNDLKAFYSKAADVRAALGLWDNVLLLSPSADHLFNLMRPYGTKLPPVAQPQGALQAIATKKPYVSNVIKGRVETEWLMYIAYPVIHDGNVRYVIGVTMNYRYWSKWLRERTPPGAISAIIDRNYTFLARSEDAERLAGQQVQPWYAEVLASKESDLARGQGVVASDVVVAFTRSKVSGWHINVLTSGTVLDAPMRRTAWFVLLSVIAALAIAITLALTRAAVLTRGIRTVQEALEGLKTSRRPPALRSSVTEIQAAMDSVKVTADVLIGRAERLTRAQEGARLGLWDWDLKTNVVQWSEGIYRLVGAAPNQFPPSLEWWQNRVVPEEKERVLRDFQAIAARGGHFSEEFRIRRLDDTVIWVACIGTVDHDADGIPARMQGVNIDITGRKEAEALLRQSEAKFRTISHAAPAMVWVSNASGEVDFLNERWFEYTGQTPEQAKGSGWLSAMHSEDAERLAPYWLECRQTGDTYEGECRYRRKDGQYRWFAFRALPTRDARGAIEQWFGCSVDIHDARQAQELLKEADRRKDDFLATLAHELRNPLAPIRNALHILNRRHVDDPMVQAAQEMMDRQVSHMVRLIDDLLDVNRITRGKLELRREPVELGKIVEQSLETSRPLLTQELTVTLPAEPIYLDADPVRLSQILSNLFNNAAKYTPKSGRISIRADLDGAHVVLRVRDTGEGISREQLPRLFQMFSQAGSALEHTKGGLGIGLSLARSLVELHGGTIEAHSDGPGKGSEFVVRLPVLATPDPTTLAPATAPAKYNGVVRRILVVDDVKDNVNSLATILRVDGHDVEAAMDGLEAVHKAEAFKPDLILLDLGLPNLNGLDACEHIRRQPWGKEIVIVALTGWGHEENRRRTLAAGFDAHLVKPIRYDELLELLARVPAKKSGGRKVPTGLRG
jgi:PAS domain S-box-containing protein